MFRSIEKSEVFARRYYIPRIIASLLGCLAVMVTLYQINKSMAYLLIPLIHALTWPHIAYLLSRKDSTHRSESRNMCLDSFNVALWIPLIEFNLLPSIALLSTLWLNNIAAGGIRLFIMGLLYQSVGILTGIMLFGFELYVLSNMAIVIACIPLILIYPLSMANNTYQLNRALKKQKAAYIELSQYDNLTGIFRRDFWEQLVEKEFSRAQRQGNSASLIFFDIDHFKMLNDNFGHATGDDVLRMIGRVIKNNIRTSDISGRYGGEEFGIILTDTNSEESYIFAERLRRAIESNAIVKHGKTIKVTASFGIAEITPEMKNYLGWLSAVDSALYQAKAKGRNCITESKKETALFEDYKVATS